MTTVPQVTIILPVYNVELYLRQCLDSVVNQTMREIQIICVNDGSTDGSRVILQEYADQDSRIEIIDQENQGGGSARNAAYPYIRGKYTYFVDPDDWIDLDLCRQCVEKADATGADCVALRHIEYNPDPKCSRPFDPTLPEIRQSPEEKHEILQFAAPWRRFWRSDLLLANNIRFSEGKRPANDVLQFWKGTVLADRIAILDRPLYHYRRIRPGSYQQTINEKHFVIIETFNDIGYMLQETGLYEVYRDAFIAQKLSSWHYRYEFLPASLKPKFAALVRDSLTEDDREFYRTAPMSKKVRLFCKMVDGGFMETMNYHCNRQMSSIVRWIIKPLKKLLKTA